MSSGTTTQTRMNRPVGRRGGRGGNRGRGGHKAPRTVGSKSVAPTSEELPAAASVASETNAANASDAVDVSTVDDAAVCWICAEPVKYYSLSECNHRTCHVCALRLRALYKKMELLIGWTSQESQPSVIFTTSPDATWSAFTPDKIPYKDSKLSISFETAEMMEETLILLRFNCPDPDCDYIGNGWSDLKLHTRATHAKLMCDLCIRFKKVFAHEHALYAPSQLPLHLPSMGRSHKNAHPKEQIEGGVHPFANFAASVSSVTTSSMRTCASVMKSVSFANATSFRNYDALPEVTQEQHFMHAHHPCMQPQCLARKFVVFGTALDLKAHMVEDHGADMSARDKKDARRVPAAFEFEEVGGGGRRGRHRERDRDPSPAPAPRAGPHGRYAALVARVNVLAPNAATAVPAIMAAVRSYRASESAARDLISTVWNILDRNLDGTASVANVLVDFFDEEDKKRDLLNAWNGFKIEQRGQFPELVPTAIGTEWAGVTSGRVLNAKHSTASRSSAQSSRQVWDRVARAAASSTSTPPPRPPERFPPLQAAGPSTPFRQQQRITPWASSSVAPVPMPRGPTSVPGPGANAPARGAPVLSKAAFPELPTTAAPRVPKAALTGNQSLRNILGESVPTVAAWGGGGRMDRTTRGKWRFDARRGPCGRRRSEGTVGRERNRPQEGEGKAETNAVHAGSFPT
ncbi:E3 ubiquitin-protein ligase hel2 [Grifola frondosa]|uniref:E3 ubiquitin-protein ligase hel2 n=1 Tax=Grifola frondosa TaxID=5627 RepID=A0A1C7LM31_GRIFR|nr:E3 ubiquitin-protein ligase hel2 [Grifola frondosa]